MPVEKNTIFYLMHLYEGEPAKLGFPDISLTVDKSRGIFSSDDHVTNKCVDFIYETGSDEPGNQGSPAFYHHTLDAHLTQPVEQDGEVNFILTGNNHGGIPLQ
jgi:hypothetical protein